MLNFLRPNNIDETNVMLNEYVNAKLLAGGTDLLLELKREKVKPEYIIDLGKLSELKAITEEEDKIILGSMVTFAQLLENTSVINNFKALIKCASSMGSPQIRNMATIGGNIVNAGSAADIIPCIISLGGNLLIEHINGTRCISCEEYFKNYNIEKIRENELLTKIIIPNEQRLSGYYKLGKRNSLAIARISVAISLELEEQIIKNISVCLGAVGRFPFRALELERLAIGENVKWLFSEEPLKLLENEVSESIKTRKTMPFKKEGIKGVFREALKTTLEH